MNICVFASSSDALREEFVAEALQLSSLIAERNYVLINGGANVGLMEAMLIETQSLGAKTFGIIPKKMDEAKLVSAHLDELIITEDMKERKAIMRKHSDAFIALAGGFGTLEEILEVITLKQLDYHNKPIVFINTDGFYDDLFRQFDKSYAENFAKPVYQTLYHIANSSQEAMEYISNYKPCKRVNKWYEVPRE